MGGILHKVFPHRSLLQHGKGRTIPLDHDHIGHTGNRFKPFRIAVDHRYFMILTAQHLGQMAPHLSGPGDYDFHSFFVFLSARTKFIPLRRRTP